MDTQELDYLEQLSEQYPTISRASAEIINLQSILQLPKSTEQFISDIHGEYEASTHVLRNGSGAVRKKIDDVFGHTLSMEEKSALATLIYYPKEKIELVRKTQEDMDNWYKVNLYRLIEVGKTVSSKYTRSKLRKALQPDYVYIIEELLTEKPEVLNKEAYYEAIVNSIVELGRSEAFIEVLAHLIQHLVIDHLHVLGDVYDRGPAPDKIMDRLCTYHSVDVQWGNHDIIWMGAAAGQETCVVTVVRNSIRYGNIELLEDGYGITMLPLATFAMEVYADDPCERFVFKGAAENENHTVSTLIRKMHKAITIIRLKLEGQMILKYPEFGMQNRLLLDKINYETGMVTIDGKEYRMMDLNFPTIDPEHPYDLTPAEQHVVDRLVYSYLHCEKLQKHIHFMLKKGGMYLVYNDNLLYHGCIPMNEDGSFREVQIFGKTYSGKALFDVLESYVRKAFNSKDELEQERGKDMIWYIWTSPDSPLYGRVKMATFERYFLEEEDMKTELKNAYYRQIDRPEVADRILKEFGLEGDFVHIINGHVPVHRMRGERPVKSDGKVIVIDGGFSKTYRSRTGIAGYTLIYNSYGLALNAHEPFVSLDVAVREEMDIVSRQEAVEWLDKRLLVKDTDNGKRIRKQIEELRMLIKAYEDGDLEEDEKAQPKDESDL